MKIKFADKDLERCAVDEAYALRRMGKKRAELYKKRIRIIQNSCNFEELKFAPGGFHELTGNRKGQWACSLDQPYRLILKGAEANEPVVWAEVIESEILEIVDYHK